MDSVEETVDGVYQLVNSPALKSSLQESRSNHAEDR